MARFVFDSADDVMRSRALPAWQQFEHHLRRGDRVAIIHHADADGLIGAAYVCQALERLAFGIDLVPYWVATEDFSFEPLLNWIESVRPTAAVICDISIANHANRLAAVAKSVAGHLFIYDDHFITDADVPANVILMNPLLDSGSDEKPIPAFIFAYELAQLTHLHFPDWLLLFAIYAEGVDEFYFKQAAALLGVHDSLSAGDLRRKFRHRVIAEAGPLIRAEFSLPDQQHVSLALLREVARGEITHAEQIVDALKEKFALRASELRGRTTTYIDQIEALVGEKPYAKPTSYLLFLDTVHAVIGPVCSVLRGKFPQHIFVGRIRKGNVFVYELRAAHNSAVNLAELLAEIAQNVRMISQGGHPSGAGALVDVSLSQEFESHLCNRLGDLHFDCEVVDESALLFNRPPR